MIVQAAPREHHPWIIERLHIGATKGFKAIEAVDDSGRVRGMVGYDGWTKTAALMHIAIETPAAVRALLRPSFEYLFVQAGRELALAMIEANNLASLKFSTHLGFRETYRIKDGVACGEDMVLLEFRKSECRWLNFQTRKAA